MFSHRLHSKADLIKPFTRVKYNFYIVKYTSSKILHGSKYTVQGNHAVASGAQFITVSYSCKLFVTLVADLR